MLLSLELIYYGDCREMIQFYLNIFENADAEIRLYEEMPFAEALGIEEYGRAMVWRASLTIQNGNYAVRFKLSDSILTARQENVTSKEQAYHPLICIEHPDEQQIHGLLEKIYCGAYSFEDIQKGIYSDKYGIRWIFKKSERLRIYHCLEFKGNCSEIMRYIGNAYRVPIIEVVEYKDSPYKDMDSLAAKDKIYCALMEFQNKNYYYAVKFSDSVDSAVHNYSGYGKEDKLWFQIIIVVQESDETHLKQAFERLSVGAVLNRRISPNEDGILYGSMIDRYGIVWELYGG